MVIECKTIHNFLDRVSSDLNYDRRAIFTRNSMSLENISEPFPWFALKDNEGLVVTFSEPVKPDDYKECIRPAFKVHLPNELPFFLLESDKCFFSYEGALFEIFIEVDVIYTDEDLADIEPEERGCFFENERRLKFFQQYSFKNCEAECYSNISLAKCGCVPFFLVRDKLTRICDTNDYVCSKK